MIKSLGERSVIVASAVTTGTAIGRAATVRVATTRVASGRVTTVGTAIGRAAATRVAVGAAAARVAVGRGATGRAATGRAATSRDATVRAAAGRAASARVASARVPSARVAAARVATVGVAVGRVAAVGIAVAGVAAVGIAMVGVPPVGAAVARVAVPQGHARAARFAMTYTCAVPLLGTRSVDIDGTLTAAPNRLPADTATRVGLHISRMSLRPPVAIDSWTATADIDVAGAESTVFRVMGTGGPVPAFQSVTGDLSGGWTPRAAGVDRLRIGRVVITARTATFGEATASCTPRKPRPVAELLTVLAPDDGSAPG
ncbi:hypothetical protein GCM10029978_080410 [Actinoallomurus acanthiterrae]